jgi:hypothetical protein
VKRTILIKGKKVFKREMEKKEKVSKILFLEPLLSNLMTSHHAGNLSIYFQIVPVLHANFKENNYVPFTF